MKRFTFELEKKEKFGAPSKRTTVVIANSENDARAIVKRNYKGYVVVSVESKIPDGELLNAVNNYIVNVAKEING